MPVISDAEKRILDNKMTAICAWLKKHGYTLHMKHWSRGGGVELRKKEPVDD